MADNVIDNGSPDTHLKALQGRGVLVGDQVGAGITIQIGIKDSDIALNITNSLTKPSVSDK
jgi:hypothetical protein